MVRFHVGINCDCKIIQKENTQPQKEATLFLYQRCKSLQQGINHLVINIVAPLSYCPTRKTALHSISLPFSQKLRNSTLSAR